MYTLLVLVVILLDSLNRFSERGFDQISSGSFSDAGWWNHGWRPGRFCMCHIQFYFSLAIFYFFCCDFSSSFFKFLYSLLLFAWNVWLLITGRQKTSHDGTGSRARRGESGTVGRVGGSVCAWVVAIFIPFPFLRLSSPDEHWCQDKFIKKHFKKTIKTEFYTFLL